MKKGFHWFSRGEKKEGEEKEEYRPNASTQNITEIQSQQIFRIINAANFNIFRNF